MFQIRRNAYRSLSSPSRTLSSPQPQRKREAEPNDHDAALEHRRQHSENTGAVTRDEYPQAHRSLRLAFRDDGSPASRLRNLSSTSDVVELRSPAKRARTPTAADYHNAPHDDGPFCPPATTAFPSRSRSMPSAAKTPVKSGEYVVGGVNVTAETAELSYDHEDNEGRCLPAFPVSSVKRHPAETSGEAWGSPPRSKEVRRRATLTRLLFDCHHQSVSPALSFISYLAAKKEDKDRLTRLPEAATYQASPQATLHTSPGLEPHTGSWSPSALEAFANEDHIKSGQYRQSEQPHQQHHQTPFFEEHGRRSTPPAYGASGLSPSIGGVAIRGSPIATSAEREQARRGATTPAPGHGTGRPAPQSEPSNRAGHQSPAADGADPWTDQQPSSEGRETVRVRMGQPPPSGVGGARGGVTLRGSPVESPPMMPPPPPRYFPGAVYSAPSPYHGGMPLPASTHHSPPAMALPHPHQPSPAAGKENNTCSPASAAVPPPPPSSSSADFKPCSCKKSKCLKLYCECFKAQRMCGVHCKCADCHNSPRFADIRNKAIADTIAKKPRAFDGAIVSGACKCKNTACLKKYCECYSAGILCGDKCKCVDCKNYLGSEELIQKRRKDGDRAGLAVATAVAPAPAPMAGGAVYHHPTGSFVMQGMHPAVAAQYGYNPHGWQHQGMMPPGMMAQGLPPPMAQPRPQFVNTSPYRSRAGAGGSSPSSAARRQARGPRQVPAALGGVRRPVPLPSSPQDERAPSAKKRYFGPELPATSNEVAMKIFAFVDNESRFTSSLACKEWNDLVKQSFQR